MMIWTVLISRQCNPGSSRSGGSPSRLQTLLIKTILPLPKKANETERERANENVTTRLPTYFIYLLNAATPILGSEGARFFRNSLEAPFLTHHRAAQCAPGVSDLTSHLQLSIMTILQEEGLACAHFEPNKDERNLQILFSEYFPQIREAVCF